MARRACHDRVAYIPRAPELPRWLKWTAGAAWFGLVVVGVAITDDGLVWQIIKSLAATAASVAFAAAGLGVATDLWNAHQWRVRTGYLALNNLDRSCRSLRAVVRCAENALEPAIKSRWLMTIDTSDYVHVPTDESRNAVFEVSLIQLEEIQAAAAAARDTATQNAWHAQDHEERATWDAIAARNPELASPANGRSESGKSDAAGGSGTKGTGTLDEADAAGPEPLDADVIAQTAATARDLAPRVVQLGHDAFDAAGELCPYIDDSAATQLLRATGRIRDICEAWGEHFANADFRGPKPMPASTFDTENVLAAREAHERADELEDMAIDTAVAATGTTNLAQALPATVAALGACYDDIQQRPGMRALLSATAADPAHIVTLLLAQDVVRNRRQHLKMAEMGQRAEEVRKRWRAHRARQDALVVDEHTAAEPNTDPPAAGVTDA